MHQCCVVVIWFIYKDQEKTNVVSPSLSLDEEDQNMLAFGQATRDTLLTFQQFSRLYELCPTPSFCVALEAVGPEKVRHNIYELFVLFHFGFFGQYLIVIFYCV